LSLGRSRSYLMWRSALKALSASQVVQGDAKYTRSKHIKLRNQLVRVWFSVNSFKKAFGVGLFKLLLAKNCRIFLCNCSSFTLSFQKAHIAEMVLLSAEKLWNYSSCVAIFRSSIPYLPKTFHYISQQWYRSRGCKLTPKSLELSKIQVKSLKIRAKSRKIRTQMFRQPCSICVMNETDWWNTSDIDTFFSRKT